MPTPGTDASPCRGCDHEYQDKNIPPCPCQALQAYVRVIDPRAYLYRGSTIPPAKKTSWGMGADGTRPCADIECDNETWGQHDLCEICRRKAKRKAPGGKRLRPHNAVPPEIIQKIRDLRNEERSFREVGEIAGVSTVTAHSHAKDIKVYIPHPKKGKKLGPRPNARKVNAEKLREIKTLRTSGLSWPKIGKIMGLSCETCRKAYLGGLTS